MALQIDDDLKDCWSDLEEDFNFTENTSKENIPFENSKLFDALFELPNDASFTPLMAHDMTKNHDDFAPATSENTWEIEFNNKWQVNDRDERFNRWCDRVHTSTRYRNTMDMFKHTLGDWIYILSLENNKKSHHEYTWFRPPHFPSTLKMSLEVDLNPNWSTYYKQELGKHAQRRFKINFAIKKLYYSYFCNLIDAIYYAKCVNWDAAYDPKHSAKTNIPIYWIMAEIQFDFPSADISPQQVMQYPGNTSFKIPISCFGLMNVDVNTIKDWYKLSPYFEPCNNLRAAFQINDQIEVYIDDGGGWTKGTIIDNVILNNNSSNQMEEPIVEYLEIQTTDDAIVRFNRYDCRVRPILQTQKMQSKNVKARYKSKLLNNINIDDNQEKQQLLSPPSHIDKNVAPQYQFLQQPQTKQSTQNIPISSDYKENYNTSKNANFIIPQDPRLQTQSNVNINIVPPLEIIDETKYHEEEDEKKEIIGPDDPTPPLSIDLDDEINNFESQHINQDLFNQFDPKNANIIKQYQTDLQETMETMKKLALDRSVVADIFRPVHLTCPKHCYRKTLLDEQEINMSVIERNTKFDYIEVKMIDPDDPQLSQMKVYMTPQQIFQHCTTYFHFTEMEPIQQDIPVGNINDKKNIIHNVPPQQSPQPPNYSPSRIHQYFKSKSPQKVIEDNTFDHGSPKTKDPRAHLQDPLLMSFLHEEPEKNGNEDMGNEEIKHLNKSFGESWEKSGFRKATKSSSIDSKTDENDMNENGMFTQQAFIENNWNARQTHLGLGASPDSNSNSNSENNGVSGGNVSGGNSNNTSNNFSLNSSKINDSFDQNDDKNDDKNDEEKNDDIIFQPWNTSPNEQDNVAENHSNSSNDTSSASIQNDEDDVHNITLPLNNQLNHENIQQHNEFHINDNNEMPATPQKFEENTNPDIIEEDNEAENPIDDNDDNDDNRLTISSFQDDEDDLIIDSTKTPDNKLKYNVNDRTRNSVERIIIPPNKVKDTNIEENNNNLDFKFDGINHNDINHNDNQYDDTMDDEINAFNKSGGKTTKSGRWCTCPCLIVMLPIIFGIILLPYLGDQGWSQFYINLLRRFLELEYI